MWPRVRGWTSAAGRLARADAALTALTVTMPVSGPADRRYGQPTRIRRHALSGVALAAFLLVHIVRHGGLRASAVR